MCVEFMDESKQEEYDEELAAAFAQFGTVLTCVVRIRDEMEEGQHKVSWALVSFKDESSAKKAVAKSSLLNKPEQAGWVVKVRAVQRSTAQYSAVQHSAAQHAAQHSMQRSRIAVQYAVLAQARSCQACTVCFRPRRLKPVVYLPACLVSRLTASQAVDSNQVANSDGMMAGAAAVVHDQFYDLQPGAENTHSLSFSRRICF